MSLVSIAWRAHPYFPLILLYNRDELHARPTAPGAWWPEVEGLWAGRDLLAGGTWLGVHRDGRFAFVTGYREATPVAADAPSRGSLPLAYLQSDDEPVAHARRFSRDKGATAPFNLIVGNPRQAHYAATRSRVSLPLTEGIHVLSNGLLDQRWPNADRLDTVFGAYVKATGGFVTLLDGYPRLSDVLAQRQMALPLPEDTLTADDIAAAAFVMLADRTTVEQGLPDTGLGADEERRRSAPFVMGTEHGTRSSTVLIMARDGAVQVEERQFDASGALCGQVREQWQQDAAVFGANDG